MTYEWAAAISIVLAAILLVAMMLDDEANGRRDE